MARIVLALFCLSILLLAGMAMADDPEMTKASFENQFQPRSGIFPGEISDPNHPGMLMSVEGKFDHPAETEALHKIQLFPYNGDGYIDNGVQKTYKTPLTPAFRPQVNNTHLGNANRNNIELGLLHETGYLPEDNPNPSVARIGDLEVDNPELTKESFNNQFH